MKKRKRRILLTEFAIQVYTDGTIDWDNFDKFLWKRIHRPHEGVQRRRR